MTRRAAIGRWAAIIALCALAGVAIAGAPELGAGSPVTGVGGAQTVVEPTDPANDEAPESSDTSTPRSLTTTSSSTTTSTSTSAPPSEPRPNAEVTVLVVNGTNVTGAAARHTGRLQDDGHPTLTPATVQGFDQSEIWFADGYGIEGAALAQRLGIVAENVLPVPPGPGFVIDGAALILILGPDLANQ
jgi:cytoskeletal protein RodZ